MSCNLIILVIINNSDCISQNSVNMNTLKLQAVIYSAIVESARKLIQPLKVSLISRPSRHEYYQSLIVHITLNWLKAFYSNKQIKLHIMLTGYKKIWGRGNLSSNYILSYDSVEYHPRGIFKEGGVGSNHLFWNFFQFSRVL